MTAEARLYVFDSSALIQAKRIIAPQRQWAFFEDLKEMVEAGDVCFPRAVRDELRNQRHHDTPETWALNAFNYLQHPEPAQETVEHVLRAVEEVSGGVRVNVVEADAEGEPADPYVLAQAVEAQRDNLRVRLVTEDRVDRRPLKIALTTACVRVGIVPYSLEEFLDEIGFASSARG